MIWWPWMIPILIPANSTTYFSRYLLSLRADLRWRDLHSRPEQRARWRREIWPNHGPIDHPCCQCRRLCSLYLEWSSPCTSLECLHISLGCGNPQPPVPAAPFLIPPPFPILISTYNYLLILKGDFWYGMKSVKIEYLECPKGGYHFGETLNMVCIEQSCL